MRIFLSGAAAILLALCTYAQQIPRPALNYPIKLMNGQTVTVNQLRGKPVVLEFLLTTCPHCQFTAGVLSKLSKEFGNKVQIYGIAMNENPDITGFIKEHRVTFPVGTGPREPLYDFIQHSVMQPRLSFPQVVFIDKNGNIQAQYEGGQDFLGPDQEKNVRAQLQKLTAGAAAIHLKTRPVVPKKKAS